MNQLTQEQIKTLEDAFASYPKEAPINGRYRNMKGIQEQLELLNGQPGLIFYISKVSKVNIGEDNHMHFVMDKMKVGETK